MIFTETKLNGAFLIDLERRDDSRGFFARGFCQKEFAAHRLKATIARTLSNTSPRLLDARFPPRPRSLNRFIQNPVSVLGRREQFLQDCS